MLRSVTARSPIAGIDEDIRLLHHTMRGVDGHAFPATTLLLVPRGAPPTGGWPIVAWEHGSTTPRQKTCAPSQTVDLDGGLTRDGFKSDYTWQIGEFIKAGHAFVVPDLEGLGPAATTAYPYYDLSSLARSLAASVVAARAADPRLSDRRAAVGHSDGAHGVPGLEALAGRRKARPSSAPSPLLPTSRSRHTRLRSPVHPVGAAHHIIRNSGALLEKVSD